MNLGSSSSAYIACFPPCRFKLSIHSDVMFCKSSGSVSRHSFLFLNGFIRLLIVSFLMGSGIAPTAHVVKLKLTRSKGRLFFRVTMQLWVALTTSCEWQFLTVIICRVDIRLIGFGLRFIFTAINIIRYLTIYSL